MPYKLYMVSYLNTLPFEFGLENKGSQDQLFDIVKVNPALCAQAFINSEAEIALIPIGALPGMQQYDIITDFCLGTIDQVRTVCVYSHCPTDAIQKLYIDTDSKTSALLVKIIFTHFLKMQVEFVHGLPSEVSDFEGQLLIGDKAFAAENKHAYIADLGKLWHTHTSLPFVFAVWVRRPHVPDEVVAQLNEKLHYGVEHMDQLDLSSYLHISNLDQYLSKNISYKLDAPKRQAMAQYLEWIKNIS